MIVKFLIRILLFSTPLGIAVVLIFLLEGGYSDPYYQRFTTPRKHSLIIGNSRAAQGLIPTVMNELLNADYKTAVYNYSFTVNNSAFGKVYLESIKNKIVTDGREGFFVVTVDPWSISVESDNPENESLFPENNNFLANIEDVSANPNFSYLLKYYQDPYYNILLRRFRPSHMRLHEDGWLEVSVKMDSMSVRKRIVNKLKVYRENARSSRFSARRFHYLQETIKELQSHGDVFLVRLPVYKEILKIENLLMPDFNTRIDSLTKVNNVLYLDMSNTGEKFEFTDGNHLYKTSSKTVSEIVAQWIVKSNRNKELVDNEIFGQ
jgi:hypothetical protein